MEKFNIEFLPGAVKDIEKIQTIFREQILKEIKYELSFSPFPRLNKIKKLHGFKISTYELKVQTHGLNYRIVYRIEGYKIVAIMVVLRRDLERHLKHLT